MRLEDELKMKQFSNSFQRLHLNIIFTANWLETKLHEILKDYKITTSQYNVLRILRGQKGNPMNAFAIQERMIYRNSNVTRIIEKLVEKGLVTKNTCVENRRKVEVSLTEKGAELLTNTDDAIRGYENAADTFISESEAGNFANVLDQIRSEA